jgi:hypothetical protein
MAANVSTSSGGKSIIVRSVEKIDREAFYEIFVSGIVKTSGFSRAICLGMDSISEEQKQELRATIKAQGIPINDSERDLQTAIYAIMDRTTALR